jgi:tetratricopeptide (TPR) repeat protein
MLSDYGVWVAAWRVAAYTEDMAGAIEIVQMDTARDRSEEFRSSALLSWAHFEAARGRWRAAHQVLARAQQQSPVSALLTAAFLDGVPFSPLNRSALDALRLQIESTPDRKLVEQKHVLKYGNDINRAFAEGLLFVRAGQPAEANARVQRMVALSGTELEKLPGPIFGLKSAIAYSSSDAQAKRAMLDELAVERTRVSLITRTATYSNGLEHFLRGELLHQLGRDDEALTWYNTIGDDFSYDVVFMAPAHLRKAEIYDARGRKAQALVEYQRFLQLWRNADPELQPIVRRVTQRVGVLSKAA